jgi:HEAT repeat protein
MTALNKRRQYDLKELQTIFLGDGQAAAPADQQELRLQELAIQIASTGAAGVRFLLSCATNTDEVRLRAILLAITFVARQLSLNQRARVCELACRLLKDARAMVVAEAVDTLSSLACREASRSVGRLLKHPSPYVVGSALRFFSHLDPEKAVPLLEKALKSNQAIIRQNAIDELDDMDWTPALAKIRQLLRDPDKDVRKAARTAVANLDKGVLRAAR